jgi:hypothetical protein
MDEAEYWASLEYRVCREFDGMPDRRLRSLWCDGFIPAQYFFSEPNPRIVGQVWICNGPSQHQWEFTLFLSHQVRSRDEIPWASLLPTEGVTLARDRSTRPAHPDRADGGGPRLRLTWRSSGPARRRAADLGR